MVMDGGFRRSVLARPKSRANFEKARLPSLETFAEDLPQT